MGNLASLNWRLFKAAIIGIALECILCEGEVVSLIGDLKDMSEADLWVELW